MSRSLPSRRVAAAIQKTYLTIMQDESLPPTVRMRAAARLQGYENVKAQDLQNANQSKGLAKPAAAAVSAPAAEIEAIWTFDRGGRPTPRAESPEETLQRLEGKFHGK